jgi:hypothetical protein
MSRLRFGAAQEVFEAFPSACEDIEARPTEAAPLGFLRSLASGPTPNDAIAFCAYLLPRREAVWWASQCVRSLIGTPTEDDEIALEAAENWVREPEEPRRRAALQIGLNANRRAASTWVALAAAWSGGSLIISESGGPPAPPYLTAKATRNALMLALVNKPHRVAEISHCVQRGVEIAEGL